MKISLNKDGVVKIVLLFLLSNMAIEAGAVSVPVTNYNKNDYNAGLQNWSAVQLPDGRMFYANTLGMLSFDGQLWNIHPIGNYTDIRSLCYHNGQNRIYAGAFNEFGYYSFDSLSNNLSYHSLANKIQADFAEVWHIGYSVNSVFFQADYNVLRYDGDSIVRFRFDEKLECSAVINNIFFCASRKFGVKMLNGNMFMQLPQSDILNGKNVVSILKWNETNILFVTDFQGLYLFDGMSTRPLQTDIDSHLYTDQVFCAASNGSCLAIGTVRNGLIFKDFNSSFPVFINKNSGLQNNTVLTISFDSENSLWLGLDNGLSHVNVNSPINSLFSTPDEFGKGFSSLYLNDKLYLGTSQGLFSMDYPSSTATEPTPISGIDGSVWSLSEFDGEVFCCCDKGLFVLTHNGAQRIAGSSGTWNIKRLRTHPNILFGGSYDGFFTLRKVDGHWTNYTKVKGYTENVASFEDDADGSIWLCHWMNGLFRLSLNQQLDSIVKVEHFGAQRGFPAPRNNKLCSVDGRMVVSSEYSFYSYNSSTDRMEMDSTLNKLWGRRMPSLNLIELSNGDTWALSFKMVGHLKANTTIPDTLTFREIMENIIPGFESATLLPDGNVLMGTDNGFALVQSNKKSGDLYQSSVYIRSVVATASDSVVYRRHLSPVNDQIILPYSQNAVKIDFISPEYHALSNLEYSYMLEGFEMEWSQFSRINTKEYTRLASGEYVFRVRCRNRMSGTLTETSISFTVLPPWYRSWPAYLMYAIFASIVALAVFAVIQKKIKYNAELVKREQVRKFQQQEKQYIDEAKQREGEIMRLRNEQLAFELKHKSGELANSTMNLVRKNEILMGLDAKIEKIADAVLKDADSIKVKQQIGVIRREIKANIEHDDDWQKFEQNFDMVHDSYLKRLSQAYPNLSQRDKQLCAYLKMDLSSKDIAPLLNMTVRSVEMTRYRLRIKMDLNRDVNLTEYLQKF